MDLRLHPHLPLITPRIEFSSLSQLRPPATITPRIDFAELWIMENGSGSHAVSDVPSDGDSDDEGSTAMELDLLESETSDNENLLDNRDAKIPKPQGEPGRPNSGGYNIENELCAWGGDKISQVMKFVKAKADEFLDNTQSYSKQDLTKICSLTSKQFPIVDKYENHWPVRDILKLHLKYTSETYRKQPSKVKKTKAKAKVHST